jgi:3,4-dehydroadipyl-CoA semialdehyde dehydrogenase
LDPQKVIRMNAPLLPNFFAGRWQHGSGEGTPLFDPVQGTESPMTAQLLHAVEVFGPVCTLMPYDHIDEAYAMIRRGEGSLVCSVYSEDPAFTAKASVQLASSHGRVHAISPDVAALHSGHGNVMPMSLHGGPGRAVGGEELGGLRALNFYHRRSAIQGSSLALDQLAAQGTRWPL